MKRVLSVIIAAALLMSILIVSPISASAMEKETQAVYLLGDADLNGEVTVVDATFVQRYDVNMIELSDKQLLTADADFDGDVSIHDATWIQRWDLRMKAPDGIGEPLNDVYKTKAFTVLRESLESDETADVRVYADQPHVPYMSVTDFYNQFYLLDTDLKEGMTLTRSGDEYTLTNIAGTTAIFDIGDDTISFSNFESFTTAAGIEFACSSASSKITSDSGESVDFGCPIDVDLTTEDENPYENFYDLSILSEQINDYYGS